MSLHLVHEKVVDTTPGPAWCTLEHLRKTARDPPVAFTGGYIARVWGDAPFWQAWRGNRESLTYAGCFHTQTDAVGALR